MLKLGITTVEGLCRPRSWLGRSRHASMLLFASLAERGHDGSDAYDRLVERVKLPNGTWKQTAGGRLDDVDELIERALGRVHRPGSRVSVLDLGVSTGVTSVALHDRLSRTYAVHFIASDLYRDAVAVSGRGWTVVLTAAGEPLQYVLGPFVLPAELDESRLYPVNRVMKTIAQRCLVPAARHVIREVPELPYLERRWVGPYRVLRLPLFCAACLARLRGDAGFAFEAIDVLRPIPVRATVVRAMNLVTRDYFDEPRAVMALAHCLRAVEPDGFLVVGRTDGLAAGGTRATCYRIDRAGRAYPVARLNGGCELEPLALRTAEAIADDDRSTTARGAGNRQDTTSAETIAARADLRSH